MRAAAVVLALAGALAVLAGYSPSLWPPKLEKRGLEFSAAEGRVLVDAREPTLINGDRDVSTHPDVAFTYTLLLQTNAARAGIAAAAGIPVDELAASGPFTSLPSLPNIVRESPVPGPPKPSQRPYRVVFDAHDSGPVLTIYAQAPTADAAVALVRGAWLTLRRQVDGGGPLSSVSGDSRVDLRYLGVSGTETVNAGLRVELMFFVFVMAVAAGAGILYLRRRPRPTPTFPAIARADDWPGTTRLLPWGIASMMALVFIVPFDAVSLPIPLPLDFNLDRALLALLALLWLGSLLAARGKAQPNVVLTRIHAAAAFFLGIACLGAVLNATALITLDEFNVVFKKIFLLGSFILFFVIVASVVRPAEVSRFAVLSIGLAVVAAAGTIVEYRSGFNPFYSLSALAFPGTVEPVDSTAIDGIGRLGVIGPTAHPLEVATMLGLVMPFAIVGLMMSGERKKRLAYAAALALLAAGALATERKTSVLAPSIGVLAIIAYRPRDFLRRVAPFALVLGLLVSFISPGAIQSLVFQLAPSQVANVRSSQDRSADYDAVTPDITDRLLMGRGYNSYDPLKYRFLDNEYLGLLIGVGLIGLVAFLCVIASVASAAHAPIRRGGPARAGPALATTAATVVFAVTMLLFDALSFPHVPYLFFFLAGLVVALRSGASVKPSAEPENEQSAGPPLGAERRAAVR